MKSEFVKLHLSTYNQLKGDSERYRSIKSSFVYNDPSAIEPLTESELASLKADAEKWRELESRGISKSHDCVILRKTHFDKHLALAELGALLQKMPVASFLFRAESGGFNSRAINEDWEKFDSPEEALRALIKSSSQNENSSRDEKAQSLKCEYCSKSWPTDFIFTRDEGRRFCSEECARKDYQKRWRDAGKQEVEHEPGH